MAFSPLPIAPQPLPPADEYYILAQLADRRAEEEIEDYRLAPAEGASREDLERAIEVRTIVPPPMADDEDGPPPLRERLRFSMFEILAMMSFVCIGMATATWMPVDVFAGVMGVLSLLLLIVFSMRPPNSRMAYLAWGTVGGLYIAGSITAVVKSFL